MTPVEYLTQRVEKVIPNSAKVFNEGARILAHHEGWEALLPELVGLAWDTLTKFSVRSKMSIAGNTVKLTFCSDAIGKMLCRRLSLDETDYKSTLALGDLMLEAFLQDGAVDIYREYAGRMAPYVVTLVNMPDRVAPVLRGTVFEKPEPIVGLWSPITGEPFIKGWTDNTLFKKYLDQSFVRTLDKLRTLAFEINVPIYEMLKQNRPDEHLWLCDSDGVLFRQSILESVAELPKGTRHKDGTKFLGKKDARLQKARSKWFEYHQVIKKAELVIEQNKPFYQEVSCDYRGRFYYSETLFGYQGSDISRSLFLFAEGKQLTDSGVQALKQHAAACFNRSYTVRELKKLPWLSHNYVAHLEQEGLDSISLDKMTLDDRIAWATAHMDKICGEWSFKLQDTAEKPYAFLAVCKELRGWSLDPDMYLSKLPVPRDASNNGWQHLAAMSKDRDAGMLVSLVPTPMQKDFYVAVAKEMVHMRPKWFADRNMPMKHIRKGIAKRGSMTRAYSAGRTKIAKNMHDDCHVEGFTTKYSINDKDCFELAADLVMAVNHVCAGPLKTTKYLQKIAAHELDQGRTHLEWHTPSGFPVVYKTVLQHERRQRGTIRGIKDNKDGRIMHVIRVDVINKDTKGKVPCRRSFASGISPNFVHSMDAAHLANTANAFDGAFCAVHDSYATHAEDVSFLTDVAKMTFIAQYDVENFFNVIDELLITDRATFPVVQPPLGTLDVNEVVDSDYFLS
jgi:DNA-directed RNA polymerase